MTKKKTFILCDAYGATKVKDGRIYDLSNDTYIEIDFKEG